MPRAVSQVEECTRLKSFAIYLCLDRASTKATLHLISEKCALRIAQLHAAPTSLLRFHRLQIPLTATRRWHRMFAYFRTYPVLELQQLERFQVI